MTESWTSKWNERYAQADYAYGEAPNEFFKQQLAGLSPGRILFPAEGEGRNAVYAAIQGWQVEAFDISIEGQKKARQLAARHHVSIHYQVGSVESFGYVPEQFDAMALIYAHFPPDIRAHLHQQLNQYIRRGGTVILEGFSKNHLDYQAKNASVGGPKDLDSLFSMAEIQTAFSDYEVVLLEECEVMLAEGACHVGKGAVIRFVGRKR